MTRHHLVETIQYRGREIDLVQYAGAREYGVVSDRITVATEGYLAIFPTLAEAKQRVDEIVDSPPHFDVSVEAIIRGMGE